MKAIRNILSISRTYRPHGSDSPGYKITLPTGALPLPLAWAHLFAARSPAARIHRAYSRAVWRSRTILGRLHLVALFACWPFQMLPAILAVMRGNAAAARAATGKGWLRQFVELTTLVAGYGFRPANYYMFELYLPERRAAAGEYIHRYEMKEGIYRLLKTKAYSPLQGKRGFAEYCCAQGLPVTPLICGFVDGEMTDAVPPVELPPADIFVKRSNGRGGAGAEIWRFANGAYRSSAGTMLDAEGLLTHIARLSRKEPYLLQRREVNHSDIADLSPGALATARIITVINERGESEPVRAVFRMGKSRDSVVDNFHAGGIAAPVDLATGRLGQATDFGLHPSTGWLDRHPATGAEISGRILPRWPEALALAARAHGHFRDRLVIGWDIALTPGGWLIVEGNGAADVDNIQRPHRTPLGQSRYAELVAWHLEHRR